jgi:hypothetical protein
MYLIILMSNTATIQETKDINEKIQLISRQTDLTEAEIIHLLEKHDNDPILVIKSYFGIKDPIKSPIKSINQEIYKQLRHVLKSTNYTYQQ